MKTNSQNLVNVLKYWLQCIRYEEALASRPKAWRKEALLPGVFSINMKAPTSGRTYFKLSFEDIVALLAPSGGPVTKPFDTELSEFFESWLAGQYRTTQQTDEGPKILVTCPTVQLRFGELAGLIRFPVLLKFGYGNGENFVVPTWRDRKKGTPSPPPPNQVHLRRSVQEEGLPFFIDGRLMSRELAFTREEVTELFSSLEARCAELSRPVEFLGLLAAFLDGKSEKDELYNLLHRLTQAMAEKLTMSPHAERCYPVGIVMDASRGKVTWHLQRELSGLIQRSRPFDTRSVLRGYLAKKSQGAGKRTVQGIFSLPGLTPSQDEAAMRFLGSRFTAVEGPPGTGKTTLVLHLAAHLLTARIATFRRTKRMPTDITVVTSTNNRAVDNVIDGLTPPPEDDRLPLAIRSGSRRICREVLGPRLRRTVGWLKNRLDTSSAAEREAALESSLKRFDEAFQALEKCQAPEQERLEAIKKKKKLERALEALGTVDSPSNRFSKNHLKQAKSMVRRLDERLSNLSIHCEGRPSKRRLGRVRHNFETKVEPYWGKTAKALEKVGMRLGNFTAPDDTSISVTKLISRWEDAAEDGLSAVLNIDDHLSFLISQHKQAEKRTSLEQKLAVLEIPAPQPVDAEAQNRMRYALFTAAEAVREAWAANSAESLLDAVEAACREAEETGSLRRFNRTQSGRAERLAALFPVWGSTLLSLGNVFDDDPETIDRVIIDEAGQCHPAYAVSALMRCRSAMIIGDVNQLTPIFGLTEQDEEPIRRGVFSDSADEMEGYRVYDRSRASVQLLAEKTVGEALRLTDHFRCQKEIIDISNRLCDYNLTVHTPRRSKAHLLHLLDRPVRFISVPGEQERLGGSWWNREELVAVADWLDAVLGAGIPEEELAVITPYRGQLYQLRRMLAARGIPIEFSVELRDDAEGSAPLLDTTGLAIGTVHRFQGGERSIVFFSTVVTSPRSLQFLNERVNLINVAVSRAMDHLVVLGHGPTLEKGRLSRLLVGG